MPGNESVLIRKFRRGSGGGSRWFRSLGEIGPRNQEVCSMRGLWKWISCQMPSRSRQARRRPRKTARLQHEVLEARVTPSVITRVSVDSNPEQAGQISSEPVVSGDGRYVAFTSEASNLVVGDTNGVSDVFVRDRDTGMTTRISVASDGTQANSRSFTPAISGDGRYIAFASYASNLVPDDTNGVADIFVYDQESASVTRVSVGSTGAQVFASSFAPDISGDGRYVSFESSADYMVPEDTDGLRDVFVRDLQLGSTEQVSVSTAGVSANAAVQQSQISTDGRFVVFQTAANNLTAGDTNGFQDVYLHQRESNLTMRVSEAGDDTEGNNHSAAPVISRDGRFIAFQSAASNLVPGDSNRVSDIFLVDRELASIERVSMTATGGEANGSAMMPTLSDDGSVIAYRTTATNLTEATPPGAIDVAIMDLNTGELELVTGEGGPAETGATLALDMSDDGNVLVFASEATSLIENDRNGVADIFAVDRAGETLELITAASMPSQGNADSFGSVISLDNRYIAFHSAASNLVPGDRNDQVDAFVHDTQTQTTTLVSVGIDGIPADAGSYVLAISQNGRYVLFESDAANLIAEDNNAVRDLFVRDILEGTTIRVSTSADGIEANGWSSQGVFTPDGRYIAFISAASNLTDNDDNNRPDFFFRDLETGAIQRFSPPTEVIGNESIGSISFDGSYLGVTFTREDLTTEVGVYNTQTQTFQVISQTPTGEPSDGASQGITLSGDGRFAAFISEASNLVANDTNDAADVFVRDLVTGQTTRLDLPGAQDLALSYDGYFLAYTTAFDQPELGDTNQVSDVYLFDATGQITLISYEAEDSVGNAPSFGPMISPDGQFITFQSEASNFVANDTNQRTDVFVVNLGNTPPRILSNNGVPEVELSIAENSTAVTTVLASDPNAITQTLTYSLSGADADLFNMDLDTGAVTFAEAPDYEAPVDADGDNRYVAIIEVSDGEATTTQTLTITITNVNEQPIAVDDAFTVATGQSYGLDVLANDTDPDGDSLQLATVSTPVNGRIRMVDNHAEYTPNAGFTGIDTFMYTVNDGNGMTATATATVTVEAAAPQMLEVMDLVPTSTGVTVTFSQPFDPEVLNLYDANGAYGLADLTVMSHETGMPLRGTVFLAEDYKSLTFVATGGIPTSGFYHLTLRSAADGFRMTDGTLLDGDDDGLPGGDYGSLFTIERPREVVVGIPDLVRGTGQAVNYPADTTGVPLSLSNGAGITTLSLSLSYDPALLAINDVLPGTALPEGAALSTESSQPGQMVLTLTSPIPLPAGPLDLGRLIATIPEDAPYAAKQILDITEVVINDGQIGASADDAVHMVQYLGDIDGDGKIQVNDVSLQLNYAAQRTRGFVNAPLVDPNIIGDINGDQRVQVSDVILVLQQAAQRVVDEIPAIPNLLDLPTAQGPDPKLYIAQDLQAVPGGTISVPIELEVTDRSGINLSSAAVVITYDPSVFTITAPQLGTLLGDGFASIFNMEVPGRVIFQAVAFGPGLDLAYGALGELFRFDLTVNPGATGDGYLNLMAFEGTTTALYNAAGESLILIPAPTNGIDAVDGRVTILPEGASVAEQSGSEDGPALVFGLVNTPTNGNHGMGLGNQEPETTLMPTGKLDSSAAPLIWATPAQDELLIGQSGAQEGEDEEEGLFAVFVA